MKRILIVLYVCIHLTFAVFCTVKSPSNLFVPVIFLWVFGWSVIHFLAGLIVKHYCKVIDNAHIRRRYGYNIGIRPMSGALKKALDQMPGSRFLYINPVDREQLGYTGDLTVIEHNIMDQGRFMLTEDYLHSFDQTFGQFNIDF